jgi:hypothetical protein
MASSGTDDEDTAEFVFVADGEQPQSEMRPEPLDFAPDTVVRAGRRFRLMRWEVHAEGGKRAKPRFIYRLISTSRGPSPSR